MISSDCFHNILDLVDMDSVGGVLASGVGIESIDFDHSLALRYQRIFCHSANSN